MTTIEAQVAAEDTTRSLLTQELEPLDPTSPLALRLKKEREDEDTRNEETRRRIAYYNLKY